MIALNLNTHSQSKNSSTNENSIDNVLCEVKWFGKEKRYGFLRTMFKSQIQEIIDQGSKNKNSNADKLNDNPSQNSLFLTDKYLKYYRNCLTDLEMHNDSNSSLIAQDKDIFIHGSKLDLFKTDFFLMPGDLVIAKIIVSCRGPQADHIHKYFIAPRHKNSKICIGYVKWFNIEDDYGFISSDQVDRDIFVSGKGLLKNKINPSMLKKNIPVTCHYTVDENRYVAHRIELPSADLA